MQGINEVQFQQNSETQCNMQHASMTLYLSGFNWVEEKRQQSTTIILTMIPHLEGNHYYTRDKALTYRYYHPNLFP